MCTPVSLRRPMISLVLAGLLATASPAVLAQGVPPTSGSPVERAGDVIIYFADLAGPDGIADDAFNPFDIDGEALMQEAGVFFVTVDFEGEEVHEGEIAIFPQFRTPFQAFSPGPLTPRMIPFAMRKNGACLAGYVAGHPLPDYVMQLDVGNLGCHALTVESVLLASYAATAKGTADAAAALAAAGLSSPTTSSAEPLPPVELTATAVTDFDAAFPTGLDLEVIAWAAYNAAYARASTNGDVFAAGDAEAEALRAEMLTEIRREGFEGVTVTAAATPAEARACAEPGTTVLRVGFSADGQGVFLAAAGASMVAAQEYDPATASEMTVTKARDCATSGLGRAGPGSL
jgi:hypothetical protein